MGGGWHIWLHGYVFDCFTSSNGLYDTTTNGTAVLPDLQTTLTLYCCSYTLPCVPDRSHPKTSNERKPLERIKKRLKKTETLNAHVFLFIRSTWYICSPCDNVPQNPTWRTVPLLRIMSPLLHPSCARCLLVSVARRPATRNYAHSPVTPNYGGSQVAHIYDYPYIRY